ncbi:enoyl-CoA hydratase/isomerase family protein [Trujillonella endophytica]|uniref:Enoyl-CoA hydratase/carnithine racemase n=1 Tax=Trujillonella endophytica TaxID=673521 RepID=A0A1H8VXC2_9ACTN|nr:enoyl-CoA hydratase/isomerase family protein [Trujillella endophytica]SEP20049.1 Enoyl-CoA hydratase/carnithine racemase [Trujillella endophytica]
MGTVTPGYATLAVERRGPVGWLVFDRPRVGNAMDAVMMAELPSAWRELDADPAVRCIVVTGRGRAFQTGLDVVALARDRAGLREQSRRTRDADLALTGWHLGVETPVVVAVNGICAGGGLHFVVDADVAIASTAASFTDPHVSVGQASNWEAVGMVHRMPAQIAARLALLGAHERMDAASALRYGLVGQVVAPEELETAAQELAERIAEADPAATRARKRALWRSEELGLTAALDATRPVHPVVPPEASP